MKSFGEHLLVVNQFLEGIYLGDVKLDGAHLLQPLATRIGRFFIAAAMRAVSSSECSARPAARFEARIVDQPGKSRVLISYSHWCRRIRPIVIHLPSPASAHVHERASRPALVGIWPSSAIVRAS